MKRILVTGAGGFVSGSVIAQAPTDWEVHALSGKPAPIERPNLVWHTGDIRDPGFLHRTFELSRPDAVVHSAAIADIDFCERNRETADAVNVGVTRRIAELCGRSGARMVFLSTDTVFDGERGNYSETDPPNPVNYYGETKALAEEVVRRLLADSAIARLAWVVGLPVIGAGNAFLPKILASLQRGEIVRASDREIRTPIDVLTLGRAILELAEGNHLGVIHLSGCEALDRFDTTRRIAAKWGFEESLVQPTDSAAAAAKALRPRDVSMDNAKARNLLSIRFPDLEEGLDLIRSGVPSSLLKNRLTD